jgi:hypothetical protein
MPSTTQPLIDTRRAAHARVGPTKRETCRRILAYGRWRGLQGFTTDELAAHWGVDHNHVAPRVTELFKAGALTLTRERRATRSGCLARVYVVSQERSAAPPASPDSLFGDLAPDRSYRE